MRKSLVIDSSEGLPIRVDIDAPAAARALVIAIHGFKGFKNWGFFPWMAEHLSDRHHLAICRFNMSRSGIGEDPESFDRLDLFADDTYTQQLDDVARVIDCAQSQFPTLATFLLGHSRGGGVALLAAHEVRRLEGVVTWSAISKADRWSEETKLRWRRDGFIDEINQRTRQVMRISTRILDDFEAHRSKLDIRAAAVRLRAPLLAIHGGQDSSVPVQELAELTEGLNDVSRVIIGSASHTFNATHPLLHIPSELKLITELSAHFFAAYA